MIPNNRTRLMLSLIRHLSLQTHIVINRIFVRRIVATILNRQKKDQNSRQQTSHKEQTTKLEKAVLGFSDVYLTGHCLLTQKNSVNVSCKTTDDASESLSLTEPARLMAHSISSRYCCDQNSSLSLSDQDKRFAKI